MKRTSTFFVILSAVIAVSTPPASAVSLTQSDLLFSLDSVYTGSASPQGASPWLTAAFENLGTNLVQLTLQYSGSSSGSTEYVTSWFFNFDPALEVLGLDIKLLSGTPADPIIKAPDGVKAGGNLSFDLQFSFAANSFNPGDSSTFLISSTVANELIDALSFSYLSSSTSANYYSAANILGITGGLNSWISAATAQTPTPGPGPGPTPVPEAATIILLGLGLGGLTIFGRKKLSA